MYFLQIVFPTQIFWGNIDVCTYSTYTNLPPIELTPDFASGKLLIMR